MTIDELTKRIEGIAELRRGDDEQAHLLEDELHHDVLKAIGDGNVEDASELARLAVTTLEIRFSRWYA